MDEILYPGPQPSEAAESGPAAKRDWREELRDRVDELLFRWDAGREKRRFPARAFLLAALFIAVLTTVPTVYTRGYEVTVDGTPLGIVSDRGEFERIVGRVEDRVSEILGYDYDLTCEVDYKSRIVERSEISSLSGFETYLFNQVDEVSKNYTLTIDGKEMGVLADATELEELLAELKAPYQNANTVSCEFTVPVNLDYSYTANGDTADLDALRALLTSDSVEAVTYTVKAGDTYSGIAKKHDMTVDELMAMNPQASLKSLMPKQELTVQRNVPYLSVRSVDAVTYQEAIPAPIEYKEDDTMYQGDTKVLDPGAEGTALVTARITYLNGYEEARDIQNTRELTAPQTKVVAKGTKERPKTMAKGNFIWPVRGTITSRYGWRTLFGVSNFHGGLDIGVRTGTSVKAADGGKVVTACWHNSYGYYVVIDHENGKQTCYAHNSKLLVSVGQRVYQGQTIAKAGSTGTATGSHCHFEVRVGGQRQNPRNYLP